MASVIKHDKLTGGHGLQQPQEFNVQDVQVRAREYLAEMQRQGDQIVEQAKQEATKIREAAKLKGIQEAEQELEQKVSEGAQKLSDVRCKTAIAACEQAVETLASNTAEWLGLWRKQTVALASKMAEKLVRKQMQDNDEVLEVWLEEAIVATRDMRDLRVLVNPDDFAVAGRFLQQLAKSVPQAASAEIVPDPEVDLGGCIVRNSDGEIDQQLDVQLERLVEQLS